jgi:ABC-type branched-subunit amino acid transport system ATPase component
VNVTRTLVFCVSAFMASVGGALVAAGQQTVSSISYPPLLSLTYLVLVVICLGREPWYAVMAAGLLIIVPSYLTSSHTAYWLQLLFGLSAVAYAVLPPRAFEIPVPVRNAIDRLMRRRAATAAPLAADGSPLPATAPATLQVRDLRVTFGGNVAVDGFSLEAPTGRITGLIGPNGAGKTTTFNACSGLVRPGAGHVHFAGREITHRGPSARARDGLGRTFQQMELFDSLSVRDNVAVGWESSRAGPNPLSHLLATPAQKREMARATAHALRLCELGDVADRAVGSLSTGQRRLVELARCLAGPFRILLLDEPSSGLDPVETERFGRILERVVAERGVGVLLVEHDMSLVMDVCEQIYVLDFGRPLFDGPPADVLEADVVRSAYLGRDDEAMAAAEEGVE